MRRTSLPCQLGDRALLNRRWYRPHAPYQPPMPAPALHCCCQPWLLNALHCCHRRPHRLLHGPPCSAHGFKASTARVIRVLWRDRTAPAHGMPRMAGFNRLSTARPATGYVWVAYRGAALRLRRTRPPTFRQASTRLCRTLPCLPRCGRIDTCRCAVPPAMHISCFPLHW